MRKEAGIFAITALFLGSAALLAGDQASAQLFRVYAGVFSASPISKAEFETLKPGLEKEGFSTSDGIYWRMSDATGSVLITALPRFGSFSVQYTPSVPSVFGDSALAALISKSESVEVYDGDVITIRVGSSSLSKEQRKGTRSEYLKFDLRGGMWRQTDVDVEWK
jgi:hypothetical protein